MKNCESHFGSHCCVLPKNHSGQHEGYSEDEYGHSFVRWPLIGTPEYKARAAERPSPTGSGP
jgi:hypothetical protein